MIGLFVFLLVTTAVLAFVSTGAATADRRTREATMGSQARASLDEMLRELRAAKQIRRTSVVNGKTYATDARNIVFETPSHTNSTGIIADKYDVVAFVYDAAAGTLTETTFVNTGSQRPSRQAMVIARNVADAAYTYRVREQFRITSPQTSFALKTTSGTRPVAYVNGAPAEVTSGANTNGVTLASSTALQSAAPGAPVDIQVLYTVDPAANSTGITHVNGVDVKLTLSEKDGRAITRTVTLAGNARLRNQRT
jgi:hypothetical protein